MILVVTASLQTWVIIRSRLWIRLFSLSISTADTWQTLFRDADRPRGESFSVSDSGNWM